MFGIKKLRKEIRELEKQIETHEILTSGNLTTIGNRFRLLETLLLGDVEYRMIRPHDFSPSPDSLKKEGYEYKGRIGDADLWVTKKEKADPVE